jgi:PIN domain
MDYLLDTNAVSDIIREQPMIATRLGQLSPQDRVCICAIVCGESLFGIRRMAAGARKDQLQAKVDKILAGFARLEMSVEVGSQYSSTVWSNCPVSARARPWMRMICGLLRRRFRRVRHLLPVTQTSKTWMD